MNIVIRKAEVSDAIAIQSLIENLAHLFITQVDFKQLESFKLAKYIDYLQDTQYCFFVALDDHKIVGVIAIKQPTHLYHLYVDESYHGQGVARKLWQHLLHFQIKPFPEKKWITVNSSLGAVEVYQKFGFIRLNEGFEEFNGIQFVPMKYIV